MTKIMRNEVKRDILFILFPPALTNRAPLIRLGVGPIWFLTDCVLPLLRSSSHTVRSAFSTGQTVLFRHR